MEQVIYSEKPERITAMHLIMKTVADLRVPKMYTNHIKGDFFCKFHIRETCCTTAISTHTFLFLPTNAMLMAWPYISVDGENALIVFISNTHIICHIP